MEISDSTVRRRLREAGLYGRKAAKNPLLTKRMKNNRLEWAKAHENWSPSDWQRVILSDESKFNLYSPDGFPYVRRKVGERYNENCTLKTVKDLPSQMVWGCFSYHNIGQLEFLQGVIDGKKYKKILEESFVPSMENHLSYSDDIIFQDDSAPCHRAKLVSIHFI
jgi:hypothetical protein